MKEFKSVALIEVMLLVMIGFFSLDFLPRNFNEFKGICSQTWPTDAKQLQICMQPYYRQTGLDKYAIGIAIGGLIIVPIYYILKRNRS